MHLAPVVRNLELAGILKPADDIQVGAIELRTELVLGIEAESLRDLQAADGAERESLDVLVLREILRHAIRVAARSQRRIAHRQAADATCRRQISLLQ